MKKRIGLALLALVLVWGAYRALCPLWSEPITYANEFGEGDLLAVGDFQRTSRFERWFMHREQNDEARVRVIREMSEEPNVGGLLLLGDLVFDGSSCADWEEFDVLFGPLAQRGVLLALGNHDYWGPDPLACANVEPRFPWLTEQTWGVSRWGDVAIVWLDSNDHIDEQAEWLEDTLDELDSMKGVIVMTHHPPYTNSTVTADDTRVQEAFVTPLSEHPNVLLFLSGHTHSYERFQKQGVVFVVSGGGGGPRVELNRGYMADHEDRADDESPKHFHWLRIRQLPDRGLEVSVRGFQKGGETSVIDRFTASFPNPRF